MAAAPDIREYVEAFVAGLEARIRDSIRASFEAAMGGAPAPTRAPKAKPAVKAAAAPVAKAAPTRKRKKGEKRPPAELAKVQADLLAFIQKNPGKRIEEINKPLGLATSELSRPLSKLIAAKQVRRTGEKRASRYFPTGK